VHRAVVVVLGLDRDDVARLAVAVLERDRVHVPVVDTHDPALGVGGVLGLVVGDQRDVLAAVDDHQLRLVALAVLLAVVLGGPDVVLRGRRAGHREAALGVDRQLERRQRALHALDRRRLAAGADVDLAGAHVHVEGAATVRAELHRGLLVGVLLVGHLQAGDPIGAGADRRPVVIGGGRDLIRLGAADLVDGLGRRLAREASQGAHKDGGLQHVHGGGLLGLGCYLAVIFAALVPGQAHCNRLRS
jgi:hypothetical protein